MVREGVLAEYTWYYVVTTVKTCYSVRERQKGRRAKGQGQGQVGKPTQIDLIFNNEQSPFVPFVCVCFRVLSIHVGGVC